MASQIWTSVPYLLLRSICWILLFAAALLDGIRHSHVRSRGRQLYAGVVVVLGAMVVQDVLLLFYSVTDSGAIFSVYIFFTDTADSLFTALLLVIAAGFCITRDNLGPYKSKVIGIPVVYFVSILVVDYIMDAVRGRAAFNVADFDAHGQRVHLEISEMQRTLLVICALVNLLALMAAWVVVFDTIAREREMLEMTEQDVYNTMEEGQAAPGAAARNGGADATGHAVLPPVEIILAEEDQTIPNFYGNITSDDLDGPKTVEETVTKASKITLLRQFSYGVIAYVVATALVVLLPIFVTSAPGEQAIKVVLIMQNVVLFGFMGGLAWIFRLRAGSQYLLMEEDGPDGELGEMRTELGVMGTGDAPESGNSSPHSMQNYSLDDAEHPAQPPPAQAAQSAPKAPVEAPPAAPAAAPAAAVERQAAPCTDDDGLETVNLAAEAEDVKMIQGVERSA